MVAFRYLRARRQEGFISVIAIFSLLGIMLGVATLIIVMSVMNGFHAELLREILGFNGHLGVVATQGGPGLKNFDKLAADIKSVPGVVAVRQYAAGLEVLPAARLSSALNHRFISLVSAEICGAQVLAASASISR